MSYRDNELFEGEITFSKIVARSPGQRLRLQIMSEGVSRTVQSEKDLTDINYIVAQFDRTGILPQGRGEGSYGDVSELNKPLQEVVDDSIRVMSEAKEFLEVADSERKAKAKKQADDEREELEQFRKAKKAAADSSTDQPSFGGKGDKSP
ncbi:MAG: internal scaffolding protein [Microviridae sp.]|nr:MAG: internal scaffolding protein [Microviridae sp.]